MEPTLHYSTLFLQPKESDSLLLMDHVLGTIGCHYLHA